MALTVGELEARTRPLRLLLLDVDGVLTDGTVAIAGTGDEFKAFSIRDGAALIWAQRAGLEVGLLSGRASAATTRRAAELEIPLVVQGVTDKRASYLQLVTERGLKDDQVAYMGDGTRSTTCGKRSRATTSSTCPYCVEWVCQRPRTMRATM